MNKGGGKDGGEWRVGRIGRDKYGEIEGCTDCTGGSGVRVSIILSTTPLFTIQHCLEELLIGDFPGLKDGRTLALLYGLL